MASIPLSVVKYIRSMWMAEMIITYLHIDENGHLVKWGGYPQHYGLTDLVVGKSAIEQVSFLEGLLNIPYTQVLHFVQMGRGRSAHVHVVPLKKGAYVLMFDATVEHNRQQKTQQQVNELSLLTYRQSQLLQELEIARQNLADEKRQLEQASEIKSHFLANLSQQLRTPLTSIVGYTKLLEEVEQADAQETSYLTNVKNNANQLLALIDHVLEQAKLEVGQVVLQPNSCDIKQLLADLKVLFHPTVQEKGFLFETNIQGYLPGRVLIDELRFRQILINLVTNVFKSTPKDVVQVMLSWQTGHLQFLVTDENLEPQPKILTSVFRNATAQKLVGTGLGLAITHHIIMLMGGELIVESASHFKGFVQAPLAHTEPSDKIPLEVTSNQTNILLADDNIELRTLMEAHLKEEGYTVITANNGLEAIKLALQIQPDLILMDMQMPVLNGYEAVQQLRAQNFTKPIIALSSSIMLQDQNYALTLGCDHYLVKPVLLDDLLNQIKQRLLQPPSVSERT
jgi:signal transduction histidine kinase/CheY-like chemotaxis protein